MLGRNWQRLVVLLLVALATLFVCSCGGDEGGSTVTTRYSGGSGGMTGGTAVEGEQIVTTGETPAAFVDAYKVQPVVVLFYVPSGRDDQAVLESLQRLQTSFPSYAFFIYDYSKPQEYGDLSTTLGVDYSPELVLFDSMGTIKKILNGYVDDGTLNQLLVNLGRL